MITDACSSRSETTFAFSPASSSSVAEVVETDDRNTGCQRERYETPSSHVGDAKIRTLGIAKYRARDVTFGQHALTVLVKRCDGKLR